MGITVKNASPVYNERTKARFRMLLGIYVVLLAFAFVIPSFALAEDGSELTDLFQTTAFTGSWEVFSKFNWLGKLLNFLISAFCLIGLVLTAFRIILTMLYKSNEAIFDRVYDLKQHGRGQKFFGFGAMGREVFNGNYGVGLDAIVGFLLSLLPDIKAYSDYNPEKMMYNLQEDDTLTTYVLKVSVPTIMSIFFFAIGFNGTLLQGFGNVANAMAVGAKKLVEVDLAEGVEKVMGAGSWYQFSFDTSDPFHKYQYNICRDIYTKMLLKMKNIGSGEMQALGQNIQNLVKSNVTEKLLDDRRVNDKEGKVTEHHELAKNYAFKVYVNADPGVSIGGGSSATEAEDGRTAEFVWNFSQLGVSTGNVGENTPTNVHLIITKKVNADETNYYELKDVKKEDGGSGDGTTIGKLPKASGH